MKQETLITRLEAPARSVLRLAVRVVTKANIGKLDLSFPFSTIAANLVSLDITEIPITFKDLEIYLSLPLHHRDPFDRILIAQAMNHALTFISQDAQMDAYPIQRIWG